MSRPTVEVRFSKLNCLSIVLSPSAPVDVLTQFIKRVGHNDQGVYSGEVCVIDGSAWNSLDVPPFSELAQAARKAGLILAGARHWPAEFHSNLNTAGLCVLEDNPSDGGAPEPGKTSGEALAADPAEPIDATSAAPAPVASAPAASATPAASASQGSHEPAQAAVPTLLIDQPVRSGQKIYARGCDAVIMAPVNAGAEIIADGNIHVYGALRGRALAGASGNLKARIIATNFEPELVAIAGYYLTFENGFPSDCKNNPVNVRLEEQAKHLKIDPLNIR